MKNDSFTIAIIFFLFFAFIISAFGSYKAGVRQEYSRIYNKCLDKNSEMSYTKAIESCREELK
jgi:Golgi nucleoside diphosphatase